MSLYRIKQFCWSIFSKLDDEDIRYEKSHLNAEEYRLFCRLKVAERKHCIRVAKHVENHQKELVQNNRYYERTLDNESMVKVALLHDIGKIEKHLNVIDKSILVILNRLLGKGLRKVTGIKKINVYYNHGELGAEILRKYGYNERFLYLIKNHHSSIQGDKELEVLAYFDSIS